MIFTQAKKLSPLEKVLLALSLIPLIAAFSLWKLIWVLPLCLAALHFIHGENPRHGRFILLAIVAAALTVLSFATQVWMEHPPRYRTLEYYADWQGHDFGTPWWFAFDLATHVAIVAVAARLAFEKG